MTDRSTWEKGPGPKKAQDLGGSNQAQQECEGQRSREGRCSAGLQVLPQRRRDHTISTAAVCGHLRLISGAPLPERTLCSPESEFGAARAALALLITESYLAATKHI